MLFLQLCWFIVVPIPNCHVVRAVNFPTHGGSSDMVDTLPPPAAGAGCAAYKLSSAELSLHGGSSSSSSSTTLQLLDHQHQRQHVCSAGGTASSGTSMLPSFGFTQEQVRELRASYTGWPKNGTIGQWRRRLECVVQQQGGHIEHLMQKLQDVTVTLDNNGDNKHVVSC